MDINIEKILEILKKPNKSKIDFNYLIQYFKNIKFFEEFYLKQEFEVLNLLFNALKIQNYSEYKVIFYANEESDKMFIILKGEVSVFYNKSMKEYEENKRTKKSKSNIYFEKNLKLFNKIKNNKLLYNSKLGIFLIKFVTDVNEGNVFGDVGMRENTKRNANIICKDNCILGIITKKEYDNILKKRDKLKHENLIFMLKNIFSSKLENIQLNTISNFIKLEVIKKPNLLFNYNAPAKSIIVILEGQVKLIQKFKIDMIKIPDYLKANKNYMKFIYLKSKNDKNLNKSLKNKLFEKTFFILNENSMLGLCEYIDNIKKFDYKAEIITPFVKLLCIKTNQLDEIYSRVPLFKKIIYSMYDNKKNILSKQNNFTSVWKNQYIPINYENLLFKKDIDINKDEINNFLINISNKPIKFPKNLKNKKKPIFLYHEQKFENLKKKFNFKNFKIKEYSKRTKLKLTTTDKLNKSFNELIQNKYSIRDKISFIKKLNKSFEKK